MKRRASILVSIFAAIVALIGLLFTLRALGTLKGADELHRLLTYDYLSLVDGQTVGGMVSDFFIGLAMLLIGSVLLMKVDRVGRLGQVAAGILLLFISLTMVCACLNPRIGVRPY